ncbi:MAG TPA: universal stress protein [Flavisolibacter sp.]|jgi:nucleotide-binding universal stress UspA family protein|nr:universal stress protein [Flavisolibacter sp.]
MKKFIVAFDGLKYSDSAMSYAIHFALREKAHLVGVSLEDLTHHSYGVAAMTRYEGESFDRHLMHLNERDDEIRKEAIGIFRNACEKAGLTYSVHRDRNVALQELVHESVYADLLILAADDTMTRYDEPLPTRFCRDVLEEVHCPVLLVPSEYRRAGKVVLLYDGEPSSVYAARAFSYLFDHMKELETEIVTVKPGEGSLNIPDNRLLKEFIKRHYPQAVYVTLKGYPDEEIVKYLRHQKADTIVVLGAYYRGRISRFFRQSMADHLQQHVKLPLFIARNK